MKDIPEVVIVATGDEPGIRDDLAMLVLKQKGALGIGPYKIAAVVSNHPKGCISEWMSATDIPMRHLDVRDHERCSLTMIDQVANGVAPEACPIVHVGTTGFAAADPRRVMVVHPGPIWVGHRWPNQGKESHYEQIQRQTLINYKSGQLPRSEIVVHNTHVDAADDRGVLARFIVKLYRDDYASRLIERARRIERESLWQVVSARLHRKIIVERDGRVSKTSMLR